MLQLDICPKTGDRVLVIDKSHRFHGLSGRVESWLIAGASFWVLLDMPNDVFEAYKFERSQLLVLPRVEEDKMVKNIYRRYAAIRVETLRDCLNVLGMAINSYEAREIIEQEILKSLDKAFPPERADEIKKQMMVSGGKRLITPHTYRGDKWKQQQSEHL